MTRKEFDQHVLYVEQDTGVIGDPEEIEQLWQLWKDRSSVIAKSVLKLGLIMWHYQELTKAGQQKHHNN